MKAKAQVVVRLLRCVDWICLAAVGSFVWAPLSVGARLDLLALLLLVPVHGSLIQYFGLYESHRIEGIGFLLRKLLSAQIVAISLMVAAPLIAGRAHMTRGLIEYFIYSLLLILSSRICVYAGLRLIRSRGYDVRNVCVIGPEDAVARMEQKFALNPAWGLRVVYAGQDGCGFRRRDSDTTVAATLQDLLRLESVDEVLISAHPGQLDRFSPEMKLCEEYGVTGRFLLSAADPTGEAAGPQLEDFVGTPTLTVGGTRPATQKTVVKRSMDIVMSSAALLVLAPLLVLVAILVKLSSKGPVLFRQQRVGRNGRQFTILKFRTMIEDAESLLPAMASRNITQGPTYKSRSDWRVTPVGQWLRRFSLDELPQFFNVLKGDMSMVGPRPLPIHEARAVEGPFRKRFTMRPGITCLWQVSGRSDIGFARWMKMDLDYVEHWSFWMDARLIIETIPAVISGRGAY